MLEETLAAAIDHVVHVRRVVDEQERERATREAELQALLGAPHEPGKGAAVS